MPRMSKKLKKELAFFLIVENAIRKLEKIPEPECSQFVAATKAGFLAERDSSIRQRLAAAKAQEKIIQGHDLSGKERFRPETRHIITLEVQKQCFVGFQGERFRFHLSDEGYRNARRSEQDGEIKIKSHAAVVAGSVLRTADDWNRLKICSNHHRGSYTSPALAKASYPFVDLPDGIILQCKPLLSDKFSGIQLYFFDRITYNGVNDKSEFVRKNI
jgi:hypothetical protein